MNGGVTARASLGLRLWDCNTGQASERTAFAVRGLWESWKALCGSGERFLFEPTLLGSIASGTVSGRCWVASHARRRPLFAVPFLSVEAIL